MKALFTLGLSIVTLIGYSQIKISEKSVDIDGSKNGFFIEVPYGDAKQVDKALKKELKGWKGSFNSSKFYFVDDSEHKKMGENTFDVYATTEELSDGGANVLVAIDLGGAFLNSNEHGDRFKVMEGILREFAVEFAKEIIQEEVDEQEDILKGKEKELEDLEDEQKDLEKEIEDLKKQIEDNEKAIEESKKNQETKKEEIKQQETVVKEVVKKQKAVK